MAEAVSGAPAGAPQEGNVHPCDVRDQLCGLREAVEGKEELNSQLYELGLYKSAEKVPEGAQFIVGSVDATEHMDKEREEVWYREKAEAAQLMLAIINSKPNKFDAATQALVNANKPILKTLASQRDFIPANFKANFEAGIAKPALNGKDGVYNLVLAFQRICDFYKDGIQGVPGSGPNVNADARWQDVLQNDSRTLHLNIGSTVNNEKERYTKTYYTAKKVVLPPARPPEEPTIVQPPPVEPPVEDRSAPPVEDPNRPRPLPPEVPEEPPAGPPPAPPAAPPPVDPNAARPLPPDPE